MLTTALEELAQRAGTELGVSEDVFVSQDMVDAFADVTGDQQWIHTDPFRAAESPFGGTIAHGYLTLALAPPGRVASSLTLNFERLGGTKPVCVANAIYRVYE
jgi:acyl dehydratase